VKRIASASRVKVSADGHGVVSHAGMGMLRELADGMPYAFNTFDPIGQTPPLVEVLAYHDNLDAIPIARTRTGVRHDETPFERDVLTFLAEPGR
jgi:hypothetical protein